VGLFDRKKKLNNRGGKSTPKGGHDAKNKRGENAVKPVLMEAVILKEIWSVAKDNLDDYFDHATRADVHRLNASTAVKPDAKSDEAYA
jgi:hypothetical protein